MIGSWLNFRAKAEEVLEKHQYDLDMVWTGNLGSGTSGYLEYTGDHVYQAPGKAMLSGSSDSVFGGEATQYIPEELFVASVASSHMLRYLHLCASSGIRVLSYADSPSGTITVSDDGGSRFSQIILQPEIVIADAADIELAHELHKRAFNTCLIASSCNFPVRHLPSVMAGEE